MSFEGHLLAFTLGAATGATAVALVQALREGGEEDGSVFTKESFNDLIQKQVVFEEVNGAVLAPWYREFKQHSDKNLVFFLCKLTKETQTMLGIINVPEALDSSHYLVQAAVDKDACAPVAVRLVSFGTIVPALENAFAEKDFIIVEG